MDRAGGETTHRHGNGPLPRSTHSSRVANGTATPNPVPAPRKAFPMAFKQHDETQDDNVPVVPVPQISVEQLKGIETIDDALELLRTTYGEAAVETAAGALGDGFALTKNKEQFLEVPLVFVHWTISDGDYPVLGDDGKPTGEVGRFVAARVVSKSGKHVIVDGGTGIAKQLIDY